VGKTVVDRVRELEGKSRLLTSQLIDAIWVIDLASMTYEYISASIERISGFTTEELIGASVKDRMSEQTFNDISKVVEDALSQLKKGIEPTRVLEAELYHKNGSTYWIEITVKALKESGGPFKAIGVSKDITQRKILEKEQKNLIEELRSTVAEKERLLAENRMLREILPLCSGCKRIRDENDRWWPLDIYVERHTESNFSHTICPDCKVVIYESE
jgi:PAS domain S-box-containing protein